MADQRRVEKEWAQNDPAVDVTTIAFDEPVVVPGDDYAALEKHSSSHHITRSPSKASEVADNSPASEPTEKDAKKKWIINPLKRNPPPVPDERGPSREPTAHWFSWLTFHWITPILMVSTKSLRHRCGYQYL
jgi:ATP-binding cassette, subfamily C (CFTR/MRP), member 1